MKFLRRPCRTIPFLAAALLATQTCAGQTRTHPPAAGVNLSGAEYGGLPGQLEKDYHYPTDTDFAWAKANGFVVIRLPFLWERLQPKLNDELNADELALLGTAVAQARTRGLATIIDAHNYGEWRGAKIGSPEVPASAFADFWRRLAKRFSTEKDVIFGLMNEPHDMPLAQWGNAAQAAIDAVRSTGACNLTLIPGANWTGAHSWNARIDNVSNAMAMTTIRDPGPHAFEFHQYLDDDWSGMHAECRKTEEVVAALSVATDWLRARKQKGFLGEFGSGSGPQCLAGLDAMLKHMGDNADVWSGWTYWAAGSWWPPTYPLSIQPVAGKPAPQMTTLAKWIGESNAPRGCK